MGKIIIQIEELGPGWHPNQGDRQGWHPKQGVDPVNQADPARHCLYVKKIQPVACRASRWLNQLFASISRCSRLNLLVGMPLPTAYASLY